MKDFMNVAKALSDENRVRAMMFLRGGELCVCQIIQILGLAPSTVSKHMSILSQAGLVDSRKSGRWIYYRLAQQPAPAAALAMGWLAGSLARDPTVIADSRSLKSVRKMSLNDVACCYRD